MFRFTQLLCHFFLIVLVCYVTPEVLANPAYQINYEEAVRLALRNNPRVNASKAQVESAQAAIIETRGAGLPKFNLGMGAASSNNPLNVFSYKLSQGNVSFADFGLAQYTGPGSINTIPNALNHPGYYNNFNTGIKLTVPIYLGGETVAKLKSRASLLAAAQHGDCAARMQLAYDILQVYEGGLAAKKLVSIAKNDVRQAAAYLSITKELYKQSIVIESDILLAGNYLRTAKASLNAAEAEWTNHLDEFRILIGRPESMLVPGTEVHFSATQKTLSALIRNAIANNAQLNSIKSNINASRANIDAIKSLNRPRVNLQLQQDWNGNLAGAGLPSNGVALGLDWKLFSSGEQSGAVQKAVAEFKQARFQFDDIANSIRISLIQAMRAEQMAEIQYKTNMENAAQAEEIVHRLSLRYGRGLVPLGQLLEIQMRLNEARNRRVLSQYNKVLARGQLLMLTNELIN